MNKKDELIAQKEQLYNEHKKEYSKVVDKILEWEEKYGTGGLDSQCPYLREQKELMRIFWEKVKKINAELEQLKD